MLALLSSLTAAIESLPFRGDSLQNHVGFPRQQAASMSPPATRVAAVVSSTGRGHVCRAHSVSQKSLLQVVQPATLRARPLGAMSDLKPAVVCRRFYVGLLLVLGETLGVVCVSAEKAAGSGDSVLKA